MDDELAAVQGAARVGTRARVRRRTHADRRRRRGSAAPRRLSRGWILFAFALLVFNFYLGSRAMQPQSRVRVPYSPFFLEQVQGRACEGDHSKGTAIQGTFTESCRYGTSKPTTRLPDRDSGVRRQQRSVGPAQQKASS